VEGGREMASREGKGVWEFRQVVGKAWYNVRAGLVGVCGSGRQAYAGGRARRESQACCHGRRRDAWATGAIEGACKGK